MSSLRPALAKTLKGFNSDSPSVAHFPFLNGKHCIVQLLEVRWLLSVFEGGKVQLMHNVVKDLLMV